MARMIQDNFNVMKLLKHTKFILIVLIGLGLLAFGKNAGFWSANTLDDALVVEEVAQEDISWFDPQYLGDELEIDVTHNPNYAGILLNLHNFFLGENVDPDLTKKYVKDILTLRRGTSARQYLKDICRSVLVEEPTRTEYSTAVSSFMLLIDEESNKDRGRVQDFVERAMFGTGYVSRSKLAQARSICRYFEDAHDFQVDRNKDTQGVSPGLVKYLLNNGMPGPVVGLLWQIELSAQMTEILLEYKDVPELAPLIERIESEQVSLHSFGQAEVVRPSTREVYQTVKKRVDTLTTNFQVVEDINTPVRR